MEKEQMVKAAIGCVSSGAIFLVVAAGLAWGMRPFYMPYVKAMMWDGSETFTCEVNEDISMSGKKANISDGPALEVKGNCKLTCSDCELKGETGIEMGGNGKVELTGGSVEGTETGISMGGNNKLETKNTEIKGETALIAGGNSRVKIRGGKVEGTKLAVVQKANGKVEIKKADVSGEVEEQRPGSVETGK